MSTVIKVENLSKRYRIGLKESRKDTFLGQIGQTLRAPIDNFRQLRSLSKFRDDDESVFWALRDINFEVQEGEVLGIIGHNGAGKSTLLKILSRITEPTTGCVKLRGRVSALLEVGTGFHPELTGRENIYMNGTILGMTRREIDRKLDEIVDFSGVEKYLDTPVKFYSSGMKVRLGFSVAAHLEPEILIIDEVLAVGDAEFQRKCLGKMENVATQGRTVLFVSHDMAAVQKLCNSCILLSKGELISQDETEKVIESYINTFYYSTISTSEAFPKKITKNDLIDITSIRLLNSHTLTEQGLFLSGQPLTIRLNYKILSQNIDGGISFTLGFFKNNGSFLFALSNDTENFLINTTLNEGYIECCLPKLPLSKGTYSMNLFISYRGNQLELIKNIILLDIDNGDFFGNGFIPGKNKSGVLMNSKWSQKIKKS